MKKEKNFVVFAKDKPKRLELIIDDSNLLNVIDELCQFFKMPNRVETIVLAIKVLKKFQEFDKNMDSDLQLILNKLT